MISAAGMNRCPREHQSRGFRFLATSISSDHESEVKAHARGARAQKARKEDSLFVLILRTPPGSAASAPVGEGVPAAQCTGGNWSPARQHSSETPISSRGKAQRNGKLVLGDSRCQESLRHPLLPLSVPKL